MTKKNTNDIKIARSLRRRLFTAFRVTGKNKGRGSSLRSEQQKWQNNSMMEMFLYA